MMDSYWKHVWESSKVLGSFLSGGGFPLEGRYIVELGAGCTGISGLIALKKEAKWVCFTDHPKYTEAFQLLKQNCEKNGIPEQSYSITDLDWNDREKIDIFLRSLKRLDYIIASDVFYDPKVFQSLILTLRQFLSAFPKALCLFAYEERDSNWSMEDLLYINKLGCTRIRAVESGSHTVHIGVIYSLDGSKSMKIFAGIEGGATQSKLVVLDENGGQLGQWTSESLNCCLDGLEKSVDKLTLWIRSVKLELGINEPFEAIGMGLSGAEDASKNEEIVQFLMQHHGEIAKSFYLTSDSIMTVAATFDKGGVILIAGTGSTCRLLTANGQIYGCGGWGHLIGDGGSGYWIAIEVIRRIFDHDDHLELSKFSTDFSKQLLLKHFKLNDKIEILDLLYSKFSKGKIASFTTTLATEGYKDALIQSVFFEAGKILGCHLRAVSGFFDKDLYENVPLILVGSIWKSWHLMKNGFIGALKEEKLIKNVSLHSLPSSPAIGAAILAAKNRNIIIPLKQSSEVFEKIHLT